MHKSLVWDIYVRVFHWLLVITVGLQWLTAELGENWIDWHAFIGYCILGLLLFRIGWGFLGSQYARFSDFMRGPSSIKNYLKTNKSPTPGHNPLGALMIIALLLALFAQAISGLFMTDDVFYDAPLRSMVSESVQNLAEQTHHTAFSILKGLVAIHVVAALFYLVKKKENLIKPLITGIKNTTTNSSIPRQYHARAFILVLAAIAFVIWLVQILPPEVVDDFYY